MRTFCVGLSDNSEARNAKRELFVLAVVEIERCEARGAKRELFSLYTEFKKGARREARTFKEDRG